MIAMPYLNQAGYISGCLQGVRAQTYPIRGQQMCDPKRNGELI